MAGTKNMNIGKIFGSENRGKVDNDATCLLYCSTGFLFYVFGQVGDLLLRTDALRGRIQEAGPSDQAQKASACALIEYGQ
jgi:hypothetical protein